MGIFDVEIISRTKCLCFFLENHPVFFFHLCLIFYWFSWLVTLFAQRYYLVAHRLENKKICIIFLHYGSYCVYHFRLLRVTKRICLNNFRTKSSIYLCPTFARLHDNFIHLISINLNDTPLKAATNTGK